MANKTDFLNLVLPANNEYNNTWDVVLNSNLVIIDAAIEEVSNEIQSARFSKTSLAEFLNVSHFDDGTLKPSDEMDDGRNSPVYGDDDGNGTDFVLKDRLDLADREVFDARDGLTSLAMSMARRSRDFDHPDTVISGAKDGNDQPNFLSSSGSEFLLNGTPTPIELNIDGHYKRILTDESVNVTGADGKRYLYAQVPSSPIVTLDRSTDEAGTTITNSLNNDKVQVFQDSGIDFTTSNVQPGYILEILNGDNAGEYIIDTVGFDGNADQIKVIGRFVNVITGLNYTIKDPLMPELDVDTAWSPAEGKCYIGEGEFSSGALISSLTYNFKGQYDSPYESVDVSSLATFEKIFNHNLGDFPKEIQVYASQANDGSEPLEPLSVSNCGSDLNVNISDTLAYSPGVFNPGSTDASYIQGTLVGDVSGNLTGSVYGLRSVRIKITKTQIFIKNIKDNHFYRDYDGSDLDSGYIKVVCKK